MSTNKTNPTTEAMVVFTNIMSAAGPRVRATVMYEGKVKGATARMTAKGISNLREWARKTTGASKLAEMVNVSEQGVFPTGAERLLHESRSIVLEPHDPMAMKLAHASFPDYTGRKFTVRVVPEGTPIEITNSWSGGSREWFVVMNLATLKSIMVPQNGDAFSGKHYAPVKVHENVCVVMHSIYSGKDMGLTFIVSEKNAAQLLPAASSDLTRKDKVVLYLLRSYKPAYRRDEARKVGVTPTEFDTIVANLKVKQYVSSTGGITPKGRNAVADITSLYQLEEAKSKQKVIQAKHEAVETPAATPVNEAAVLTESTAAFLKQHKNFPIYVAMMCIQGWMFMRSGLTGKGTAEFRQGKAECFIDGDHWKIETWKAGTGRVELSGATPEELEEHLATL